MFPLTIRCRQPAQDVVAERAIPAAVVKRASSVCIASASAGGRGLRHRLRRGGSNGDPDPVSPADRSRAKVPLLVRASGAA